MGGKKNPQKYKSKERGKLVEVGEMFPFFAFQTFSFKSKKDAGGTASPIK